MARPFPSAWAFRRSRSARSLLAARKNRMAGLQDAAQHIIDRATKSGATAADVMIREDNSFSVTVRMGEVETLKEALSRSLMLRVFIGKRTATSHTSDLSAPLVERLVDETVEMA